MMRPPASTTSTGRSRRSSSTAPRSSSRTTAARRPPTSPAALDTSGRRSFWSDSLRVSYCTFGIYDISVDRLDFLGRQPSRYENQGFSLLDFLGFSRPKRDLSMGYGG